MISKMQFYQKIQEHKTAYTGLWETTEGVNRIVSFGNNTETFEISDETWDAILPYLTIVQDHGFDWITYRIAALHEYCEEWAKKAINEKDLTAAFNQQVEHLKKYPLVAVQASLLRGLGRAVQYPEYLPRTFHNIVNKARNQEAMYKREGRPLTDAEVIEALRILTKER